MRRERNLTVIMVTHDAGVSARADRLVRDARRPGRRTDGGAFDDAVFEFALRNLRRRPARTLLTVAAIALGIAAVVALTSIAWGFEASWQKANDARGTDLIVTRLASANAMPSPFRRRSRCKAELAALPR